MELERVELADFRNYERASVQLAPGVSVFVGPNAQGKTNLLEAIGYLATGSSHRTASDAALVRVGTDAAVLRAVGRGYGRTRTVEVELRPGGRTRVRLDGAPRARLRDVLGVVRAVLFAPEDLMLIRGEPTDRRRFLDELLGMRRPAYLAARGDYERVLRQRTALLRALRGRRPDPSILDGLAVWTESLVAAGAMLVAARIAVVHALAGPTSRAYADLVAASPPRQAQGAVVLDYRLSTGRVIRGCEDGGVPDPAELAGELREGLAGLAEQERDRAQTLAGPHRDDLALGLGGLPAKGYASQGETWSLALALRLGSREVLAEVGQEPVVLLDDVFAELDERRRNRLAAHCGRFPQVLVTAAVDDDVPLDGTRFDVCAGTVSPARRSAPDGQHPATSSPASR